VFGRVWSRLTYANVMATVAVFIALGGGAYAALKLPKNSVGAKQIKRNAVTSSKVKNRSLRAIDFGAGQLPRGPKGNTGTPGPKGDKGDKGDPCPATDAACRGPAGTPGAPATRLWAVVTASATTPAIRRGSHTAGLARHSNATLGGYEVKFDQTVNNCAVTVTPEDPPPGGTWFAETNIDQPTAEFTDDEVFVRFENGGNLVDVDFHLAVFC
jgi:hypothetical protein